AAATRSTRADFTTTWPWPLKRSATRSEPYSRASRSCTCSGRASISSSVKPCSRRKASTRSRSAVSACWTRPNSFSARRKARVHTAKSLFTSRSARPFTVMVRSAMRKRSMPLATWTPAKAMPAARISAGTMPILASAMSHHPGPVRLLVGPVARAHHRPAGGVLEAHLQRLGLQHREGVRVHVTQHRQVAAGGLQVLADGEHLDVVRAHVAHDLEDLVVGLAQADHQAGLGRDLGVTGLELLEQLERVGVVRTRARLLVQARHGLEVVVHDVRRGG